MTLTAKFKLPEVKAYVQQQLNNRLQAVIQTYQYVGETFVRNARINGNYQDRTGNLRSSIGYILLKDGKQITSNFEEAGVGTDKITGVAFGIGVAEEIAATYPKGIVLICVAGMDYALYVEAKNFDVITSSANEAALQLKQLLPTL